MIAKKFLVVFLLALPLFAQDKPKPKSRWEGEAPIAESSIPKGRSVQLPHLLMDADRVRILKLQAEQLKLAPLAQGLQDRMETVQKEYARLNDEIAKVTAEILDREKLDKTKYRVDLNTLEITNEPPVQPHRPNVQEETPQPPTHEAKPPQPPVPTPPKTDEKKKPSNWR